MSKEMTVEEATEILKLRDQFAMAALTGLILHPRLETSLWSDIAEVAYIVADSMLAAR